MKPTTHKIKWRFVKRVNQLLVSLMLTSKRMENETNRNPYGKNESLRFAIIILNNFMRFILTYFTGCHHKLCKTQIRLSNEEIQLQTMDILLDLFILSEIFV